VVAARFDWQRWSARHATSAVKKSQRLVDFATAVPTEAAEAFTDRGSALSLVSVPDVERRPMAERLISERLARVLGASAAKLNVDVPLTDMGVDSLMAVELQTVIARDFGVQVPLASLLERATVAHLAETVLEQMKLDGPTSGSPAGAPTVASTPSSRQPAATASLPSDAMSTPTRSAVDSAEGTPPIAVQCELASPTPIASGAIARSREIVRSEPSLRRQRGNTPIDYATLDYSRLTRAQAFTRTVLTSAFRAAGRVNVEGLENLPAEGPVIVAINHLCAMDLPLLFTILPRRGVCLAAERLQSSILIRRFLDLGQSIYVRRGEADEKALADALAVLRAGGLVGLAPEGTRSRSGGLTRGHSGVAYLAAEAPAPILPIAAYGQERLGDNLRRLRRTEIHVRAGSLMAPTAGEKTAASLARDTERVMVALASMLPPKYRGVYASAVEPIERALDDMAAVL
jgi:1-acyl-sn-glycerol-3-phosphate acyltransferase